MKAIKSTDPRKKAIVEALKTKSITGNRVTKVVQLDDGIYQGHVLSGNRTGYTSLGTFTVTDAEIEYFLGNNAFLHFLGL